jgi:hypothetical protein
MEVGDPPILNGPPFWEYEVEIVHHGMYCGVYLRIFSP